MRPRVRFLGWVAPDALPTLVAESDVLLHTSRHEGEGLAVQEALCVGRPAVSTDVGVAAELLDGDCGEVVSEATPEALARAVGRVVARLPGAQQAAAQVGARVRRERGLDVVVERLLGLYRVQG